MDEVKNRKTIFRVIKTYPTEDRIATYEYEGTIEDLCIELSKYLGGKKTRYRRMMERWLHEYSTESFEKNFKLPFINIIPAIVWSIPFYQKLFPDAG